MGSLDPMPHHNGHRSLLGSARPRRRHATGANGQFKPVLPVDQSNYNSLCDQLIGEVSALGSAQEAATWADRILPLKNTLTTGDARRLEEVRAPDDRDQLFRLIATRRSD
jgi:hypothetical protein